MTAKHHELVVGYPHGSQPVWRCSCGADDAGSISMTLHLGSALLSRETIAIDLAKQCSAHLNIAGEDFPCDLDRRHSPLAHSSKKAQAIWSGGEE